MAQRCPRCGIDLLPANVKKCSNCGLDLADHGITLAVPPTGAGDETKPVPDDQMLDEEGATQSVPQADNGADEGVTRPISQSLLAGGQGATKARPEAQKTADEGPAAPEAGESGPTAEAKTPAPLPTKTQPLPSPETTGLETDQILNKRYRLQQTLGKGGFGAVYLAKDQTLNRLCVIKQMLLPGITSPRKLKLYQANFEREANLLAQLNHPGHPNIPEIYDYFSDESGNYLVMKYIQGRSLKDIIEQSDAALPLQDMLHYAAALSNALHYMHTHGTEPVIHRDIKPANIILGDDGRIWLVDFGLAKAQPVDDSDNLAVTQAFGTVGYTPLEQWLGESTAASDVYAFGATLHHLLTGLNPLERYGDEFSIARLQQMHGQFIPVRRVNKELPQEVEGIVASTTAADPEQRPTALQLEQQFTTFISGSKDVPLFTFKSGEAAKTKGQLVDLCDQYSREAQGYLYRGDFERWFRLINRNDLTAAALQAVKRSKNQQDGLEKFLKLVLPNLFFRRLWRAGLNVGRLGLQFGLMGLAIILLLLLFGSLAMRWSISNALAKYPLATNQAHVYSDDELNRIVQTNTQPLFDSIWIDPQPNHRADVSIRWNGILFQLPFTISLDEEAGRLNFQLDEINGVPLYFVASNIAAGLTDGLDRALCRATVSNLEITEADLSFTARAGQQADCPPPDESILTTQSAPDGDSPAGPTILLIVLNEHDQPITLALEGPEPQILEVGANQRETIELVSGQYRYSVSTEDRQLSNQGQKNWTSGTYKLSIR